MFYIVNYIKSGKFGKIIFITFNWDKDLSSIEVSIVQKEI